MKVRGVLGRDWGRDWRSWMDGGGDGKSGRGGTGSLEVGEGLLRSVCSKRGLSGIVQVTEGYWGGFWEAG